MKKKKKTHFSGHTLSPSYLHVNWKYVLNISKCFRIGIKETTVAITGIDAATAAAAATVKSAAHFRLFYI